MSGTCLRPVSAQNTVVHLICMAMVLVFAGVCAIPGAALAAGSDSASIGVVQITATLDGRDVSTQVTGLLLKPNGEMMTEGLVKTAGGLEVRVPAGRYKLMVIYNSDAHDLVLPVEQEIAVIAGQQQTIAIPMQVLTLPGMGGANPAALPTIRGDGAGDRKSPGSTAFFDYSGMIAEGFSMFLANLTESVKNQPHDGFTLQEQKALDDGNVPRLQEMGFLQMQPISDLAGMVIRSDRLMRSDAYRMAASLYKARSQAEVERLLLQALRKIGIGVYDQNGVQIQGGAERGPQDAYLYDIQVKSVAQHFLKRDWWPAAGYIRLLGSMGVPGLNTPRLTGADLMLILASAWLDRDFSDINAPEHYLPLLFLSLGMLQSQDSRAAMGNAAGRMMAAMQGGTLSAAQSAGISDDMAGLLENGDMGAGEKWDPIQVLLLSMDLLTEPAEPLVNWQDYLARQSASGEFIRTAFELRPLPQKLTSHTLLGSLPILPWNLWSPTAEAAGRCDFDGDTKGAWGAAMAAFQDKSDKLAAAGGKMGAAAGKANMAMAITGAVQGTLMAWGFDFTFKADKNEIHYIHGSEKKWVGYTVHVEYLDEWPDIVTECGWLAGMNLPKKGPLEGKDVTFSFEDGLLEHGQPGFSTRQQTDKSGNAYMEFIPNKEHPIGKMSVSTHGTVWANVEVQDWLNMPSKVGELLFPREKVLALEVSWHEPTDDERTPEPAGSMEERPFWNPFGW